MKIIVACCWAPDKGQGISTSSREMAAALAAAGHAVEYLSPAGTDMRWYEGHGIKPIWIGLEYNAAEGTHAVAKAASDTGAELVINNDHPYVQNALPLLRCPAIVFRHTSAWATGALACHNHQWADYIVAVSHDIRHLIMTCGVPACKVPVFHNGIADPLTNKNWCPHVLPSEKPLRALYAGGASRVKGADLLFRAADHVPTDTSWIHLNWFGSGHD